MAPRRSAGCVHSNAEPSRTTWRAAIALRSRNWQIGRAPLWAGSRTYETWLESQLRHFDVLAMTDATAVTYASLRVALKRAGRPIPANDGWIAALALQHRLVVLSRDQHFDMVPGLERESW